jgi:hypothetical protein
MSNEKFMVEERGLNIIRTSALFGACVMFKTTKNSGLDVFAML